MPTSSSWIPCAEGLTSKPSSELWVPGRFGAGPLQFDGPAITGVGIMHPGRLPVEGRDHRRASRLELLAKLVGPLAHDLDRHRSALRLDPAEHAPRLDRLEVLEAAPSVVVLLQDLFQGLGADRQAQNAEQDCKKHDLGTRGTRDVMP